MTDIERILEAVRKKAIGYESEEVSEEYALEDGEMVLTKRRVSHRDMPPDVAAARLLLEFKSEEDEYTDEQIAREKRRLLRLLKEMEDASKADK